ncbi:extracellular solute-binding protein [Paenibacillus sp. sptzw28]|uniref:extracellular solute-binding protein n=1 Tax=Paenibacillus sp. sptzw28 TaxID=715179 RepID=UPI002162713A|nr:extracellular solute-binding protein [Paenibacillus sp. sptzw28]
MKRAITQVSAAALLAVTVLTSACSSSQEAADAEGGKDSPTTISILSNFSIAQPPAADSPITKEFEKRTNTKLDITWSSDNGFNDKLNVLLASGDLPDLIKLPDTTSIPQFRTMVKQGAFWDLTPFISDYKNLMETPQPIWDKTKIDGKNYVVPIVRPLEGGGTFAIRRDWLDKLGLQMPTTMDELYEVMKAFKEKQPDGQKDTYGYTMRVNGLIDNAFTGSNGKWKLVDGKLIDVTLEPTSRDAILYKKKLYDEGLIPPDFSVMKDDQYWDLATSGRAGLTGETIEALWRWTYDQWKRDPKVTWEPMVSIDAGQGQFNGQNSGFIGVAAIPKKVPEAKVKKILALLDYGASEEGSTLSQYGIEGVHYKKEDGFFVTNEQSVKDSVGTGSFGKLFMKYDPYMYAFAPGMPKEVFERNKKIIDAKSKLSTPNPAVGLVSETDQKVGADYNKKIGDLKTQIIMGKASIDEWDKLVTELKQDSTYLKIIEEMNAAYKARMGTQ